MTKANWRKLLKSLEIDTILSDPIPVARKELDAFEKDRGLKLPQSYRTYCEVFGAGEVGRWFRIAVPGFKPEKELYSLHSLRKYCLDNKEYDEYSTDSQQYERALFFCWDHGVSLHFFDPEEVTDSRRHEYAVYTIFDDWSLQWTADNFWEFVTEVCLGDRHTQVQLDETEQVFRPFAK